MKFYTIESQIENNIEVIEFCEMLAELEEEQKRKVMNILRLCRYIIADPDNNIVFPVKAIQKIIDMAGMYGEQ